VESVDVMLAMNMTHIVI